VSFTPQGTRPKIGSLVLLRQLNRCLNQPGPVYLFGLLLNGMA
jgi:hypothetical protein